MHFSHEDALNDLKTKDQIIAKFGLPTSKKNDGEYEEWYYDFGTKMVTTADAEANRNKNTESLINTFVNIAAASAGKTSSYKQNTNDNVNASAKVVKENVNSFVRFTLKDGRVFTWRSNGVNFMYNKRVDKKTNQIIGSYSAYNN